MIVLRFNMQGEDVIEHTNHMTLIYTTPTILRHIFARPNFLIQNTLFHTTMTLDNATIRTSGLSNSRGN